MALRAASPPVAAHAIASGLALGIEATTVIAGRPLDAASTPDQAVVAVAASIRFSIGSEASTVGAIRMRSVRRIPVRPGTPGVVIVVVSTVPASVIDVGVVVENDGASASPESPIAVPRVPTPAKATHSAKHTEPAEGCSQGYAGAE